MTIYFLMVISFIFGFVSGIWFYFIKTETKYNPKVQAVFDKLDKLL